MLFATVLVLALVFFVTQWMWSKRANLPPGPRALPLIGHFHLLGRIPQISLYHLSKKFGPLMYLRLGSVPLIVISSPAMAREFLKTHDAAFAHRPPKVAVYSYKTISFSEGEYHKNLRRMCSMELFTARRVTSFTKIIRDELWDLTAELTNASKADQPVALRGKLRALSFNVMTRILMNKTFFGSKASGGGGQEARDFLETIDEVLAAVGAFAIEDYFPSIGWLDRSIARRCRRAYGKMDAFLENVLDEQRPGEIPDFVEMTKARVNGPDQIQTLKALLMDLLIAGSETSSTTTEWAMAELLHNPEWIEKLQQEIEIVVGRDRMVEESDLAKLELVNAVIKETFRLHPPLGLLVPHTSPEPRLVAGFEIPAKATVLINAYAIGRDSQAWPNDPDKFKPGRFVGSNINVYGHDFELLPFGSGKRGCPGLPLGLRNVQLVLSNLIHGFDWRFPEDTRKLSLDSGPGLVDTVADAVVAHVSRRLQQCAFDTLAA
ncbi:cytochrome P450 71A1 [Selaginella moellendorffii]|uniref:cytochrome P450 71A1 n=1 Tax=Selaginella moellendorffii TaxID=88036 RepID=UPI000D1C3AAD|nr:cytochrome P450 71A1 [Selaginella moellendorffii]|eukprot:XP_024528021.1 cytochrome P450 71A1 [Selaginella moellendorffii]